MEINPEIKKVLKEFSKTIHYDDALGYLLAIYFNHRPTYIPDAVRLKVNATGIVEFDDKSKEYKWRVPLFKGAETAFEWVKTEYVSLFKEVNSERGGKAREATARMKKFFAANPHRRKEEIIEATKMYLMNTDSKYVMFPHYFIEKGTGANKTYTLLDWLEKLDISKTETEGRESVEITMQ
jgi:hypothetical protein